MQQKIVIELTKKLPAQSWNLFQTPSIDRVLTTHLGLSFSLIALRRRYFHQHLHFIIIEFAGRDMPKRLMKICLITAFPPSRGGLVSMDSSAQELQRNPLLSLTVLADVVPDVHDEQSESSVLRCWTFNDRKSAGQSDAAIARSPRCGLRSICCSLRSDTNPAAFRGLVLLYRPAWPILHDT